MDPIPVLVIAGMAAGAIAQFMSAERREALRRAWRQAAERSGLTEVAESEGGLSGRSGALEVRLEGYPSGRHWRGTRIVVSGLGHGAGGLSLRVIAFEERFVGEREIETGDPVFDARFTVQGRAALALAILKPGTRWRLASLIRGSAPELALEVDASLQNGVLEVQVREPLLWSNRVLIPKTLARVLEIARLLVAPPDLAKRIAANLRREPEAVARLNCLLLLAREFQDHPATRKALRAARHDPSEEVRLGAALALGEEGRETLLDLVASHRTSDECAARAVEALGHRLPDAVAKATLQRALTRVKRRWKAALACLEILAGRRQPGTEGLLRVALRCEDEAMAVPAARALGRAGTVASVGALREAGERGGALRRAARQAIADIQSRLAGAEPGQLSLASGAAGALSLAEGEPGSLDLVEAPASPVLDDTEGKSGAKPPPQRPRETS